MKVIAGVRGILSCAAGVLACQMALAHHSTPGVFDLSKSVTLVGVISKVDWSNPHTFIYLDVTDADGKKKTFALETAPPAFLRRAGITKAWLQGNGEIVTVIANPAWKADSGMLYLRRVTRPDGTKYQADANLTN